MKSFYRPQKLSTGKEKYTFMIDNKPFNLKEFKRKNGGYKRVFMYGVWLNKPGSMDQCNNYKLVNFEG